MTVYNNDTGALICEEVAVFGQGRKGENFDEPGYIVVPPCLWGHEEDGLEAPPVLAGVMLRVVKKADATYAHHGTKPHHS